MNQPVFVVSVLELSLGELETLMRCVEYASLHAQNENFIALQRKLLHHHEELKNGDRATTSKSSA